MRIGIITQPLHANYGGLLQNYALQQILIRAGYEVETIDWEGKTGIREILYRIKMYVLHALLPNKYPHDKLEGLWITGRNSIAVANDNDFAINVKDNKLVQKILPGTDKIDDDVVYVINFEEPLY